MSNALKIEHGSILSACAPVDGRIDYQMHANTAIWSGFLIVQLSIKITGLCY